MGQTLGTAVLEGIETISWARGSIARKQTVDFWLQAWQGMGGAAANTLQAAQYLVKQLEEQVSNQFYNPAYIQWTNTAKVNAVLAAAELHDGWYLIDDFEPDYTRFIVQSRVYCKMTVTQIAPQAPRRMAVSYMGGALSSNYSGQAQNQVGLPLGSTAVEAFATRIGAEGSLSHVYPPVAQPEPFIPSATVANYFKGGVRIYDTINTAANPVPTSGNYVNANWVEARFTDHDFQGDCVLTNGYQMLLFHAGATPIATCYLWNLALSPQGWQQYATLTGINNGVVLRSYTLRLVSPDECAIRTWVTAPSGNYLAGYDIRLQRDRYDVRVDLTALSAAIALTNSIDLNFPAAPKILYNSAHVADTSPNDGKLAIPTDYGYAAAFIASTTYPFIAGFLYQNQPGDGQPDALEATSCLQLGDNTSLAVNATRSYGIFAVPYGSSGVYSTANLQAEGESGTLGTGWASTTDAAASAGNTARAASGTTAGNADTFGSLAPNTGGATLYDVWFRVRVTGTAGTQSEMTLGLWNGASFLSSTTFAANQATTSYGWLRACTGVGLSAATFSFRAVTAATLGTNWFIDEAVAVMKTSTANTGPQELWQQFMYDRSTKIVRV